MWVTIVQGAFLPVPAVDGGAVEKLWHSLGVEFASRGVSVCHISKRRGGQEDSECDSYGVLRRRVNGFDWPKWKVFARLFDLIYSLRVLFVLPDADILVTNTFFLPLLVRRKRVGLIYVSVHRFPRGQFDIYRRAARFQCVSNAVATELIRQSPQCAPRTKVVANFVGAVEEEVASFGDFGAREKRVLYVGRLHPEKGLELLIRAYAEIASLTKEGWKLDIVGPHEVASGGGGVGYLSHLKDIADSLRVRVNWIGPIFDADSLNEIYRGARVLVYPSVARFGEAFGLVPLEAMSQGTPVVVSDLECFSDFVFEGTNGWRFKAFDGRPEGNLAHVLGTAMEILGGSNGKNYSKSATSTAKLFSLKAVADQFVDDFSELLGRNCAEFKA